MNEASSDPRNFADSFAAHWGFSKPVDGEVAPSAPAEPGDSPKPQNESLLSSLSRAFTAHWGFGEAPAQIESEEPVEIAAPVPRRRIRVARIIAAQGVGAGDSDNGRGSVGDSLTKDIGRNAPDAASHGGQTSDSVAAERDSPVPPPVPMPAVVSKPAVGCKSRVEACDLHAVLAGGPLTRKELVAALRERTGCGHSAAYNAVAPGSRLSGFVREDDFGRYAWIGDNTPEG